MVEVSDIINTTTGTIANSLSINSGDIVKSGPILLTLILAIVIYSIFIWYFYRFIARRDILKLDLNKYNQFKFGFILKFFAIIFYILEYIILIPLLVIFWFTVFSILLLMLAKEQPVSNILLIAISVVGAIRFTAYFNEDLSKDLAKMIPFTLLGIAIITPGFFDFSLTLQKFTEIPSLLKSLLIYSIFIIILETILRLGHGVFFWIMPSSENEDKGIKK